jgi:hypothetical protein
MSTHLYCKALHKFERGFENLHPEFNFNYSFEITIYQLNFAFGSMAVAICA